MKRSKRISLCLVSGVVLVSCDDNPAHTYQNVQICSKAMPESICQSAYTKAKQKDELKIVRSLDECNKVYSRCEPWKSGYAPVMNGFTVRYPDDGEPYYETKSSRRSHGGGWHFFGDWGSKPRFGGFGSSGGHFGG